MVEQSLTLAVAFDCKQNDIRPVDKGQPKVGGNKVHLERKKNES